MSTDDKDAELFPFTPPPPRPDDAPRPRRRRSSRLTKTAAGLAVILGAGAGGAVVASASASGPAANTPVASASPTTTPFGPNGKSGAGPGRRGFFFPGGQGGPGGPMGVGGFGLAGPNGAIHGTFTVKGPKGGYETVDTQYGTAEAVSSSSITVKSADGFSQTYTVSSSTEVGPGKNDILSVKVGDTVSIQGLVSGSAINAQHVLDLTQVKANHPSWGPGRPPGPGGPGTSGGPGGSGGSGGTGGAAA
jgi:hypothetical protein